MIQFIGEVKFENGKSVMIDRKVAHNSDLPYTILEETIKLLMDGGSSKRNAIFEAGILLDYDESTIRRALIKLGVEI